MTSLVGKRVLLLAPRFFGYELEVKTELENRGAIVDFLPDRPFESPVMKALTKIQTKLIAKMADRFYQQAMHQFSANSYDLIFVVSGQTLTAKTLGIWKKRFPRASFVLYMWDSFNNREKSVQNLPFFDYCFSFDKNDAKHYGLIFRPLFFSPGFAQNTRTEISYDISFVGTAHSDRYAVIKAVSQQFEQHIRTSIYLFLQAKWVYWFYKLTNKAFKTANLSEFSFVALPSSQVQSVFFKSQAILDIEHARQTGLTIRTIETLGAKKKLVTTNANIADYDFYSPDNICIIDRANPMIPPAFFSSPYCSIPEEIYRKYSITGWMDEILLNIGFK